MIDLDAFIVPGKEAAGISLGVGVSELLANVSPQLITTLSDGLKYDLGTVKVWVQSGIVTQIGVYSGYRGILPPAIHIGSTIAEVETCFGCSVTEDEGDNLIVPCSPGWCFDTESWGSSHRITDNRKARIAEIFVFKAP